MANQTRSVRTTPYRGLSGGRPGVQRHVRCGGDRHRRARSRHIRLVVVRLVDTSSDESIHRTVASRGGRSSAASHRAPARSREDADDHGRVRVARNAFRAKTGLLIVPVRNVGKGPALRVEVTVEGFNAAGGWSGAWSGPQSVGLLATAIGADEMTPLEVELPGVADVPGFSLSLLYDDVAGKGWWTFTRWLPDLGRYENVAIEERPT
jgi:hypothetical protein